MEGTDVLETTGVETATQESPVTTETTESPSDAPVESPAEGTAQEAPVDGRRGPQNIRASIKAVAEWAQAGGNGALPEHAEAIKQLGTAYFREQAYRNSFPSPQDAQAAKSLIDGVGGIAGIQQIQSRVAAIDAQDEGLKVGDPAVLDALFKDFPDGAIALAPHYLDQLAKLNPEAYSAAVGPRAVAILESAGLFGHIEAMLAETDPTRLKTLLTQLGGWADTQRKAAKVPPPTATAPNDAAKKREAEQAEREQKFFNTQVEYSVRSTVTADFDKVVGQYTKSEKLNPAQAKHYREVLQDRIVAAMNADKTYTDQINIRRNVKGVTPESIAQFISGEFQKRLNDADPKTSIPYLVANEIYGAKAPATGTTGVVRPETPKTSAGGGPIKVSQRPQDSEIAEYPGVELDIINGRAKLKNGRYVTWR